MRRIPALLLTTTVWSLYTIAFCLAVLLLAALRFTARPVAGGRAALTRAMIATMNRWTDLNRHVLLRGGPRRWRIDLPDDLSLDRWYVVVANHQAWLDIFVIADLCNRRIPFIRWFMKRELLYVPLIGAVWWAMDFPFLRRYGRAYLEKHPEKRGEDRRRIRASCARLLQGPATVMVFPEGTRWTAAKRARGQPGFDRLLRPRAGGVATALDVLAEREPVILDLTLVYDGPPPTMLDVLAGWRGRVTVSARRIPYAELAASEVDGASPEHKDAVARWLDEAWARKDAEIARLTAEAGQSVG